MTPRSGHCRAFVVVVLSALGCSNSLDGGSPASAPGGGGRPTNPAPGSPAPGPATGGSGGLGGGAGGAAGSGGGAPPFGLPPGGGSADAASASRDAGPSDGGPPTPNPGQPNPPPGADPGLGCSVTVAPLSPARFTDVPAGEGYRLRVGARAQGAAVPAKPSWRWQITHESGQMVPSAAIDGDPAVVEFPTEMTGRYTIVAEILGTNQPCRDSKTAYAVTPNRLFARFRVRATPPAGRPLALFETDLLVSSGAAVTKTIDLQAGYPVTIDPQDERGVELGAFYVRVAARSSTARFDGYVAPGDRRMGFQALLELGQRYDVLLVPDRMPGVVTRAPLAFLDLHAEEFRLQSFRVDPGVRLRGAVRSAAGAGSVPIAGARVRLRSGALPSTVGESAADGSYELRARGGRFEVRVLPPESTGLPEAQLPQSIGLLIGDPPPPEMPLDFVYAAASTVQLKLTVQGSAGAGVAGVKVLLESAPDALPVVGSFRSGSAEVAASGIVRRVRTTDAAGLASFDALPRARYRATLVPPDDAPGDPAITTLADLDLGPTGAASTARTVVLGRRTRLTGRITPAEKAAGLVIKGVDSDDDGAGRTVTTLVSADGGYELPVDPGRVYRLFIEPPADRRVPRIPLEPVRARATNITLDRALPARLPLSGVAQDNGTPVAGVVVQVFCLGSAPTCIDADAPDISSTPPIDETTSGPDGRYQLYLPDPGQ